MTSPTMKPVRVFLLEDHPVMRLGLKMMLEQRGFEVCGEAESTEQAHDRLPAAGADIAVFDLSLQGTSAMSTIAEFRKRLPDLPIIIYSMHDTPLFVEEALRAGASGYVTKADSVENLIDAMKEVQEGKRPLGPALATALQKRFSELGRQGVDVEKITSRELEILTLLGQGFGLAEMAERFCVSSRTIETHLLNLRHKLGVQNNRELTRAAIQFLHPG